MKRKVTILTTVFFILIFSTAYSQLKQNFTKQNTWEIGGSLSYSYTQYVSNGNTNDNGINIFKFAPYVGYFATDGFEIGIIPTLEYISYGGGTSSTSFAIYAAPAYNFDTKSLAYPYVQGAFGYNTLSYGGSSTSYSGIAWSLEGGVKLIIGGNSLLKFGVDYSQKTLNKSGASNRSGYNSISFVAGFNVFLE